MFIIDINDRQQLTNTRTNPSNDGNYHNREQKQLSSPNPRNRRPSRQGMASRQELPGGRGDEMRNEERGNEHSNFGHADPT